MKAMMNQNHVCRIVAATAVIAVVLGFAGTASAGHSCPPRCYWKTVTVYKTVTKPCVHYVTKYDHCGRPYQVKVVTYKSVQVPVEVQVKVCY